MRFLSRHASLLIIFLCGVNHGCAQSNRQSPPTPPPPPPASVEYDESAWKELSSAEGGFTVLMPGTPSLVAGDMETGSGKVFSTRYILETASGSYIVGYTDFPAAIDDPAKIKQAMDISRENLLKDGTKLLGEKDIVLDGYPGRELLLHGEGMVGRIRSYMVKTRHYQLMLVTPVNVAFKTGQPSADPKDRTDLYETISRKYLDSFKLKAGSN